MRYIQKVTACLLALAMLIGLLPVAIPAGNAAYEDYQVTVGSTRQILLGATLTTGKLQTGTWKSSNANVLMIDSQSSAECTVLGVSSGTATLSCNYKYYVGGTIISSVWSCKVKVVGSGGSGGGSGGSGGYAELYCSPASLTLDLAKDKSNGKLITFSASRTLESNLRYVGIDIRGGYPAYVTYKPDAYISGNSWPVFWNMKCRLYPYRVGSETIRFQIVSNKVIDGYDQYFNTGYGAVDVDVNVVCSHEFGEGVKTQEASETQLETWEYTCKYCGEKMTQEILREIEATSASYSGVYDGEPHGIAVNVTRPTGGATIRYGTAAEDCELTEAPTYRDAGEYTVYYRIEAEEYAERAGSETVKIERAPAVVEIAPRAVEGLEHRETAQALVTEGRATGGAMEYALGESAFAAPTGGYAAEIPTGTIDGT